MQLTTVLPQARHRALVLDEARPLPAGGQGGVAARARGGRGVAAETHGGARRRQALRDRGQGCGCTESAYHMMHRVSQVNAWT